MVARHPLYASLREKHPSRRGEGGEERLGGPLWSPAVPLVSNSLSRCPVQWVLAEIRGRRIVGAGLAPALGLLALWLPWACWPCGCPASLVEPDQ